MRITDIRCWLIEKDHPTHPFRWRAGLPGSGDGTPANRKPLGAVVRMDTDTGVFGAVEIDASQGGGPAALSMVARRLKSLIGEDPTCTERLWHLIWELDRIDEFPMRLLGLVDQLAWDIKSKAAAMPLWQMLGGNSPIVPAYASTVTWDTMGEYERHIKTCMDVGFTAFKLHAWGDWKADADLCRNLRRWTGPDADLMFDGSAGWDYVDALRFGRVIEDLGFLWYEEPMREFELGSYAKLCAKLDIPVLAAETSDGVHWNMATWIQAGALDMTRVSSFYKGGLTGSIKIAHLSESHGMRAQVHGMGAANAQICAAILNNDYYEQLVMNEAQIRALGSAGPVPVVDGRITVSDAPGLGAEIDWERVEATAVASA